MEPPFLQVSVVYKIVSRANARICIGVSEHPGHRFTQHMRKPPLRMRQDMQEFSPANFYVQTLARCP